MGKLISKKFIFKILFIIMFFGIFFYNATAYELEEKEFIESEIEYSFKVQSLSKYSRSIINSPAFVSVIFPFELKLFYYENIADLLNFSPGMYVVKDGAYWYLGSRGVQIPGSYNSRALFLLDGFPLNEQVFGTPIDYSFPDFLSSVELIHGYSNVYSGSNSLVATINFIPYFKEYSQEEKGRLRVNISSYFLSNSGGSNNSLQFKILEEPLIEGGCNWTSYDGRNIFLSQRNEFSLKDDNKYSRFYYLFGEVENLKSETYFYFSHYERKYHFPCGTYGITLNDRKDYAIDYFTHFYTRYSLIMPFSSRVNFNVYYFGYREYGRYPTADEGFINIDDLKNQNFSIDVNYFKETDKGSILFGLEYKNVSYFLKNYDVDYSSEELLSQYLDLSRKNVPLFSFYFSYDYKFNVKNKESYWLFSTSLRYDNYSNLYNKFKSIVVPQFGVIKVNGSQAWKLIYSQNYRAPSFSESFYNDGGISTLDNPNLEPERHKTIEIIYYKEYKSRNFMGYFSTSVYFMNVYNLINSASVGINNLGIEVGQYQNVGNIEVAGGIIDYAFYLKDNEFLRLSYSYSNARSLKYFPYLSNSPKHLFLVKYAKRLSKDLWVSVENKYTSSVLDDYGIKQKEFNITNLNFVYDIKSGSITLSFHNIFNSKAEYVVSLVNNYPVSIYPVEPRTIYLNFNFWK